MDDPKDWSEPQGEQEQLDEAALASCTWIQDPFSELPTELRPRQHSWKQGLRKVTCRGWGMNYRKSSCAGSCLILHKRLPGECIPLQNDAAFTDRKAILEAML